jgi:hypothetical protein
MALILKAITSDLSPWTYAAAERFWSYPMLVILFIGVWRQHQRTRTRLNDIGLGLSGG